MSLILPPASQLQRAPERADGLLVPGVDPLDLNRQIARHADWPEPIEAPKRFRPNRAMRRAAARASRRQR